MVHLSLKDAHDQDYDYRLVAVSLDEELAKEKLSQAQNGSFDPDIVKGGYVEGTYTSDGEVRMLLQVPYDRGWKKDTGTSKVNFLQDQGFFGAVLLPGTGGSESAAGKIREVSGKGLRAADDVGRQFFLDL